MRYKYKAMDPNGKIIEDSYIANSKKEVLEMIKSNNFLALSIEEDFRLDISSLFHRKVKKTELAVFCRLFYTMINAGINISTSLEIIAEDIKSIKFKEAIMNINKDIHKGINLSDAMKKHKQVFPKLFVEMVRAGEISGSLEKIIQRLGNYYDKENKIESKIKSSLIYPSLLLILSVVVIIFMLAIIFPIFYDMFNSRELSLPLPTRILIGISTLIHSYLEKIIILLLLSFLFLRKYFRTSNGKFVIDYIKLKTPLVKKMYIKIIAANFTKTLSILLSAGIPLIKSLDMAGSTINNSVIKKRLEEESIKVEEGKNLSKAINDLKVFPSLIDSMIKIGEESGALDEMLLKTSQLYDEEVGTSLERFTKLIEPILMLIIGFIVGFIVIALALPMFDIMYTI